MKKQVQKSEQKKEDISKPILKDPSSKATKQTKFGEPNQVTFEEKRRTKKKNYE